MFVPALRREKKAVVSDAEHQLSNGPGLFLDCFAHKVAVYDSSSRAGVHEEQSVPCVALILMLSRWYQD